MINHGDLRLQTRVDGNLFRQDLAAKQLIKNATTLEELS